MAEPFLTDDELVDFTGYHQPKRQARWLARNVIRFFVNARGKVRVPRDAVIGINALPAKTAPDFSQVRKAG